MVCIDANVWIYYFDATLPEHEPVADRLDALEADTLFVTSVLQMEVVHYLANQQSESEHLVSQFLDLNDVTAVPLTTADVRRAGDILHEYANSGIGGRDASVLAAMDRCGVDTLWTHDAAFRTVATEFGMRVVDPVEENTET
ncbi:MAG: putative nucleic acid-binding protein, contains PIN domain protein [uncultured archaeon A07HN63]|jgi:Predicted nucleic acid-binding protein, contains PIN domain|nr:MAG: putative nucleic acid-binding protein, contains PIN domain protein [uncultured archaeon A07HN63]